MKDKIGRDNERIVDTCIEGKNGERSENLVSDKKKGRKDKQAKKTLSEQGIE